MPIDNIISPTSLMFAVLPEKSNPTEYDKLNAQSFERMS
jgi:hypothetical protein